MVSCTACDQTIDCDGDVCVVSCTSDCKICISGCDGIKVRSDALADACRSGDPLRLAVKGSPAKVVEAVQTMLGVELVRLPPKPGPNQGGHGRVEYTGDLAGLLQRLGVELSEASRAEWRTP